MRDERTEGKEDCQGHCFPTLEAFQGIFKSTDVVIWLCCVCFISGILCGDIFGFLLAWKSARTSTNDRALPGREDRGGTAGVRRDSIHGPEHEDI